MLQLILPPMGLSWAIWPYAIVAVAMVALNLWIFLQFFPRQKGQDPPTLSHAMLVGYFVSASPVFWIAVLSAALNPSTGSWNLLFLGMGIMMAAPAVWMLGAVFPQGSQPIRRDNWAWPALLAIAVPVNELFMGLAFVAATGAPGATTLANGADWVGAFTVGVDSYWFFWAMLVNMVAFVFWLPLGRNERLALLALAASAAVAPLVVVAPLAGVIGMAAAMTVAFVLLFETLAARPAVSRGYQFTVLGVSGAFTGMAIAQFYFLSSQPSRLAAFPFAAFSFSMMILELFLLARAAVDPVKETPADVVPWIQRPRSVTTFLALAFASEWFMAAGILAVTTGPGSFRLPSIAGSGIGLLASGGNYLANLFVLVGSVTASPYFLGLMGIEMGALVVTRIRVTPNREQRTRLSLALGAFAVYTVLAPSLVVGWSRFPGSWPNIGAFGPVNVALVPAVIGSYVVFVVLALLFGRRSYCSVICPSAVMYGGTFSQNLIPTIREASAPRHQVLGSHWKRLPSSLAYGSWGMFGVVGVISGWNALHGGTLSIGGVDVATLYSLAIWNVLWYAFFIAIPYVGMSPCRTWGWCSTGTLLGAVGRLGLYRKEALDIEVCRSCRTHDCGRSCEVGLVDMPVELARTGRFRSVKCVGAGDCEAACPYGNLVSRDVRDSVRHILGLPDRFSQRRARGISTSPQPRLSR